MVGLENSSLGLTSRGLFCARKLDSTAADSNSPTQPQHTPARLWNQISLGNCLRARKIILAKPILAVMFGVMEHAKSKDLLKVQPAFCLSQLMHGHTILASLKNQEA